MLPPDVNASGWRFTVQQMPGGKLGILFGLGAVKNVGENAVAAIMQEREKGPYKDIFDFCRRIDTTQVNKRVVESLIRAGAFDFTGAFRSQMLAVYENAMDAAINRRKQNVSGQLSLFDMAFGEEALSIAEDQSLPRLPDYPARTKLAMEKEITGVYITGHPLDDYRELLSALPFSTADMTSLEDSDDQGTHEYLDGLNVDMGGILVEVKGKATKKGAFMGFVTLEDLTGQIECLVFPKVYERYQGMMAADDLVVLSGRLSIREEESPKLLVERVTPLEDWQQAQHERRPRPEPRPADAPRPQHREPPAPLKTDAQLAKDAPRKLYLKLERAQMDRAITMLALHPGSVPVYVHIPSEKMTLLAPKLNWCDGSDGCISRMAAAFGAENVKLVESK